MAARRGERPQRAPLVRRARPSAANISAARVALRTDFSRPPVRGTALRRDGTGSSLERRLLALARGLQRRSRRGDGRLEIALAHLHERLPVERLRLECRRSWRGPPDRASRPHRRRRARDRPARRSSRRADRGDRAGQRRSSRPRRAPAWRARWPARAGRPRRDRRRVGRPTQAWPRESVARTSGPGPFSDLREIRHRLLVVSVLRRAGRHDRRDLNDPGIVLPVQVDIPPRERAPEISPPRSVIRPGNAGGSDNNTVYLYGIRPSLPACSPPTPSCTACRTSRSCAARRTRRNWSSARRRWATRRSRSPTNARSRASSARTSRRRTPACRSSSAASSRSSTA